MGSADGSSALIQVTSTETMALLSWLNTYDIFNTAVFTNQAISAAISTVGVSSWSAADEPASVLSDVTPDACTGPTTASPAFDLDRCTVVVRPTHSSGAKQASVRVSTRTPQLSTSVTISVYFPVSTALSVEDSVLNSVLPHNAAQAPAGGLGVSYERPGFVCRGKLFKALPSCVHQDPPLIKLRPFHTCAGCSDRYQSTTITALATWSNNGTADGDTVADTDVTDLAVFVSSDQAAVSVSGNVVQVGAAGWSRV